jgi:hypothetical protein
MSSLREYYSLSATLTRQLRSNAIAIISLIVALSSFSYSAWRTVRSERNRTMRQAAFQMLVALGEMKQVVYHGHYDHDTARAGAKLYEFAPPKHLFVLNDGRSAGRDGTWAGRQAPSLPPLATD